MSRGPDRDVGRLAVLALLVPAAALAAAPPRHTPPRFTDYPVRTIYHGKPAPVNLKSHPQARMFRGQLRRGAAEGVNFAGHYAAVTWGCGTECQQLAIVDEKTGRVYFAPFALRLGAEYRRDSSLLIANPPSAWREAYGKDLSHVPPGEEPGPPRSTYYRWTGRTLVKVASVDPAKVSAPPAGKP